MFTCWQLYTGKEIYVIFESKSHFTKELTCDPKNSKKSKRKSKLTTNHSTIWWHERRHTFHVVTMFEVGKNSKKYNVKKLRVKSYQKIFNVKNLREKSLPSKLQKVLPKSLNKILIIKTFWSLLVKLFTRKVFTLKIFW